MYFKPILSPFLKVMVKTYVKVIWSNLWGDSYHFAVVDRRHDENLVEKKCLPRWKEDICLVSLFYAEKFAYFFFTKNACSHSIF